MPRTPATAAPCAVSQGVRAYWLVTLMVVLRPLGNLSLAWGMQHSASVLSIPAYASLRIIANPFVLGGVTLLVFTLLLRMATLSIVDLSLVVPLTSLGYIVSTALGRFVLGEAVTKTQWLGTIFIFFGASLVMLDRRTLNTVGQFARRKS